MERRALLGKKEEGRSEILYNVPASDHTPLEKK